MERPAKVFAYIVRDGNLVVFIHADDERFDQSGLQVPGGTVRPGELIEDAVLREAEEETGLAGLRIVGYLGAAEYDARPYVDAIHVRHFFHLEVDAAEVPQRWIAFERGDGNAEPIRFELYWLPLAGAHVLSAGHGALLGRLFDA